MSELGTPNDPSGAVRRAPFGGNPRVGARGQQTYYRILDATMRVFRDVGLHDGSAERIAREAGCSRASFYQYFADKDDVLRHLEGQLRLQVDAAVAWLAPVTPAPDGWRSLRDLLGRLAQIHERHRPVFDAFPAMFESGSAMGADAAATNIHIINAVAARVQDTDLTPAKVDSTIELFLSVLVRAFEDLNTLRQAAPASFPEDATLDAMTDVFHRALFGLNPAVNVHDHQLPSLPRLPFGPLVRAGMKLGDQRRGGNESTRAAVLEAARACFLANGFHGTRIDMIAEEAGVSHGTLYTYFDSKEQVAHELALTAVRGVTETLRRMPDVHGDAARPAALRRWLGEHNRAQTGETAMIRLWADALRQSGDPVVETAPIVDWGRRQIVRRLAARGFGDVEIEAAVLAALLSTVGRRPRGASTVNIAALLIRRGFFGVTPGV